LPVDKETAAKVLKPPEGPPDYSIVSGKGLSGQGAAKERHQACGENSIAAWLSADFPA
jgi:hypothetical protein